MEQMDLEVNMQEKNLLSDGKTPKNKKRSYIVIAIASLLLLGLIVFIVILLSSGKDSPEPGPEPGPEPKNEIYVNISTSENKQIRNSFKKDAENYNKNIGNINDGNDYDENERDNFDICIPYNVTKRKDKYNAIYLNIHGGGWVAGDKANVSELCDQFGPYGIMSAAMSYTLLNGNYKQYNIFRILDEITATIKGIKKFLKGKGFDENKLELIISGGSAGGHLSLLYPNIIKNSPIPIKFILNAVGPVTLNPDYWLTTKNSTDPLENIDQDSIKKAEDEGKLIQMNEAGSVVDINNTILIVFMNVWLGREKTADFDEIFSNVTTGEINQTSEKFQVLLNLTTYAYPITYITNESIPTLCIYGGLDLTVGVDHYATLKETFDKNNNSNITLVYFRYGSHNPFDDQTEYGRKATAELYNQLYYYMNTYLDTFKNN